MARKNCVVEIYSILMNKMCLDVGKSNGIGIFKVGIPGVRAITSAVR